MGEYSECYECKKNCFCEIHHIVEKSHCQFMKNVKFNFLHLCPECHRTGKHAVHKNRQVDLRYKQELQLKLQQTFHNEYYNVHQIKATLDITKSEELIFFLMGSRNYL